MNDEVFRMSTLAQAVQAGVISPSILMDMINDQVAVVKRDIVDMILIESSMRMQGDTVVLDFAKGSEPPQRGKGFEVTTRHGVMHGYVDDVYLRPEPMGGFQLRLSRVDFRKFVNGEFAYTRASDVLDRRPPIRMNPPSAPYSVRIDTSPILHAEPTQRPARARKIVQI